MFGKKKAAPKKKAAVKKAAKKVEAKPSFFEPKNVVYRSHKEEAREFKIMNIRARRNASFPGFIEWEVTAEQNERFKNHPHVRKGRARLVK